MGFGSNTTEIRRRADVAVLLAAARRVRQVRSIQAGVYEQGQPVAGSAIEVIVSLGTRDFFRRTTINLARTNDATATTPQCAGRGRVCRKRD